jgi:hypothetical protein
MQATIQQLRVQLSESEAHVNEYESTIAPIPSDEEMRLSLRQQVSVNFCFPMTNKCSYPLSLPPVFLISVLVPCLRHTYRP